MEFAQGAGTFAYRVADLAFGNTVAEANVHGWFVDEDRRDAKSQ
jgi:hypothetical protein